jgi:regulator of protease activity HflC (stomatin/prohibitin superfamily)
MEPFYVTEALYLAIAIGFGIIIFLAKSIKIISPSHKGLVVRLGNLQGVRSSGVNLILPFIDSLQRVDIREQAVDVPPQKVICKDNVVVTVDAIVYIQVVDPVRAIYNVRNYLYAVIKLAQTNLRAVVGQMTLDETLTARESINTKLHHELDDNTNTWGVRVLRVEVQHIDPPSDVIEAMHQQMRAEREKRASILTAEGEKQSAILVADGKKQAAILEAEGVAKAIELESNAAIKYFRDGAVTKEQLNVFRDSLTQNSKYIFSADIFESIKGAFSKFSK